MFFDIFYELCRQKGISCKKAAEEIGLSNSITTKWKKTGATPSGETLEKVAAYFGVSTDYLLGNPSAYSVDIHYHSSAPVGDGQKEKPLVNGDEELTEYLEMLKTRPEIRMLFQLSKDATKEDVEQAVRVIEAIRNK